MTKIDVKDKDIIEALKHRINKLDSDLVIRYALPKGEIVYFCQKL